MRLLSNNYRQHTHLYHLSILFGLAFLRVLFSRVLDCPPNFDCQSYLSMVDNLSYQTAIPGHHAMRIAPPAIVKSLTLLGLNKTTGFYLLSGLAYCMFGLLCYGVLVTHHLRPLMALSISLLCLAPHEAMRIPLQLVYQSCDMLVYPISLMMIIFSLKYRAFTVFLLAVLGCMVRQNLFVLGLASLLYCGIKQDRIKAMIYIVCLVCVYASLQNYYHAHGTFIQLLSPPPGYFHPQHLLWVMWDSKLFELVLPILPLIILYIKPLSLWFLRYWHIGVYMAITAGQPFLAYHMTGDNFARLALQGAWLVYLALGCILAKSSQIPRWQIGLFLVYSLAVFWTWGIEQRLVFLVIASLLVFVVTMIQSRKLVHRDLSNVP